MPRSPNTVMRALERFWRAENGAAMLEFGMVALPFFLLTFGIVEISMIGFTQAALNEAVAETSRTIRTGEAQKGNVSYTQIQTTLCSNLTSMLPSLDCGQNLYLDVKSFPSFVDADTALTTPISNGQLQNGGFGYSPGSPSDVVVVRAFYKWQVITPFFQNLFANSNNGQRILISTMMFRSEPWGT
ncbi:MAG: TadE/TadG family type IV pilus assembly protein [Pseudomonadota bacterium]